MGKWLSRLAKITESPPTNPPTKPTKAPSEGFVGGLVGGYPNRGLRSETVDDQSFSQGTYKDIPTKPTQDSSDPSAGMSEGDIPDRATLSGAGDEESTLRNSYSNEPAIPTKAPFDPFAGPQWQECPESTAYIEEAEQTTAPSLSDLFAEKPIHLVRSRILGEDVLFATDDAAIPTDNKLVVYRESELRATVGVDPIQLRAIHAVKRRLDGEVVNTDESRGY